MDIEKNDEVVIQLDRPYSLRFSNKALKEYSALTQTTMKEFDDSLLNFGNQQAAAYIMIKQDCLRTGQPIPTPEQVEELLDEYVTPGRLFYLLNKAAEAAFADDDLKELAAERQAQAGKAEDPLQAAGTGEQA